MNRILAAREKIYDHIQDFSNCRWHARSTPDEFEVYCIAKDTIQDTGESLMAHREKGFVTDAYRRFLEYYGVLQAVYMQQDAIHSLFKLFMAPRTPDFSPLRNWRSLRDLRNDTVGHPVGRKKRLNRNVISYSLVSYMSCPDGDVRTWKSMDVNLATLLDAYDIEAESVLDSIIRELETVCSTKHA